MIVSDIIDRCVSLLGLEGSALQREALLNCFNGVYEELTLVTLCLKTTERVFALDARLMFTDLTKPVREVLSVRMDGHRAPFTAYTTFLKLEREGEAEVTYLYRARPLTEKDTPDLPPRFTDYPLAMGTAAEYCYRMGLTDEGKFYQSRYRYLIGQLTGMARTVRLPIRRWL